MSDLSATQIATYAYEAGFRGQALTNAVAIALAESHGDPRAIGDTTLEGGEWGPSVGLWQIRSLVDQKGTGDQRDQLANLNPLTNARHAFQISDGGTDFEPWSTYTGGEYRSYLATAARAATAVTDDPPGHHGHSGTHAGSGTGATGGGDPRGSKGTHHRDGKAGPGGHGTGGGGKGKGKVSVTKAEMVALSGLLEQGHGDVTRRQPLAQEVTAELQSAAALPDIGGEASALVPLADELGSLLGQLATGLAADKELVAKTDKAVHHADQGGVPDPIAKLLPPGLTKVLDGKGHTTKGHDGKGHDGKGNSHTGTSGSAAATLKAEERKVVDAAKSFLGVPYVYGGDSHAGVDCSALTSLAYAKAFGRDIGRDTTAQLRSGRTVGQDGHWAEDVKLLQPGDLIFYGQPGASGPDAHVVMYIGDGKVIQAPQPGQHVEISPLFESAAPDEPFLGVRRYLPVPTSHRG